MFHVRNNRNQESRRNSKVKTGKDLYYEVIGGLIRLSDDFLKRVIERCNDILEKRNRNRRADTSTQSAFPGNTVRADSTTSYPNIRRTQNR